ncbi:hypothetical protein [Paenibacillus sp. FSL L8-0463]|uniref:hypothetical protein n=1 Tax=Paenibacillus sp. FSL L8-0463 TaxID=2954687 RepID=UPI0031193C35
MKTENHYQLNKLKDAPNEAFLFCRRSDPGAHFIQRLDKGVHHMADAGADVRGGVEDVMPLQQRLEEVESGLNTLTSEFARIAAENVTANTKLRLLEENDHRHDESIKEIKSSTIKMEIQFSAIMAKFDSLESKIFSLLQQANKDSGAERKLWMDMIKYIVLIALGAAAGNQFLGK